MDEFANVEKNLIILIEECSEVIHIASKMLRFGIHFEHPETGLSNVAHLEQELGDVQAMRYILENNGILSGANIEEAANAKIQKLKKWYGEKPST
jgi:NTP pyrophosphatase (non-canonical NTP hydrolase)